MVVPGLIATGPFNMIGSRFLCDVHQNMRFFFFLKLHLIKGRRSAAAQTSKRPDIKSRWIITCFIGPFTTSGFWSRPLRDDASETEVRSFKRAATNPRQLSRPPVTLDSAVNAPRPGNIFTLARSGFGRVDTCSVFEVIVIYWQKIHLLDDPNDPRLCSDET